MFKILYIFNEIGEWIADQFIYDYISVLMYNKFNNINNAHDILRCRNRWTAENPFKWSRYIPSPHMVYRLGCRTVP